MRTDLSAEGGCCDWEVRLSAAPRAAFRCRCGQVDHDDTVAFSQPSQHLEVVDTKSGCKRLRVLASRQQEKSGLANAGLAGLILALPRLATFAIAAWWPS